MSTRNQRLVQELNDTPHDVEATRTLVSQITGQTLDASVEIRLPFYTDFGGNLTIGKRVYVSHNVMFTDLGGITLADDVLIGPGASLLTVNHQADPAHRHDLDLKPIYIGPRAWIGAKALILPGVTVGANAIVGAGAVVTKDVPANTVVAGVPAKVIKTIGA
ncbi:sugar O-acetyltransferase [Lactiplantibacillus garii]|uniref:Sugar O-acetyltransferase n=1 Tax=Lactiplantibacillus garii TaxID=2306423 RepID=A0A426D641_9LACO|nr:sugar O-acetyltransferase [Lactiplantibacillus garii]